MGFAVVVQEAAPSRGRGLGGRGRYLPTVARLTSTTSLSNSPRMRGAPELIWRIKSVPPSTALCSMKVDGSRFSGRLPGMGAITYSSCTLDSDGHAANPNSTSAHYKRINRRRRAYFSAVSRPTRLSPRESEVHDHVAALKIEPDLGAGAVRKQCINDHPIIAEVFHLAADADPV
jgi:hypothetical protein